MNVLLVVAHPDDEVLGAGGAIARHVFSGDLVRAISMTDGVGARDASDDEARDRGAASQNAATALGFAWTANFAGPDNGLDRKGVLYVARAIESILPDCPFPDIVYTHHVGDCNQDHVTVHRAVLAVFRPQDGNNTPEVRTMEVPSSTEWGTEPFAPNLFVGLKPEEWSAKVAGLRAYDAEMREWPHARSYRAIEYLARHRGSQVGLPMAEAFCVIRRVEA